MQATTTINNIQYTAHREGADIICIPTENDNNTLILHDGYIHLKAEAYMQAKWTWQVDEIAHDLMSDFVLENESELVKIDA